MTRSIPRLLAALAIGAALLAAPATSDAAKGDCGQPTSAGPNPAASDAQTILRSSVGQATACDAFPCICDVNGSGSTTTSDALLTLKKAVGQEVILNCSKCPGPDGPAPCTSAVFESRSGSDLDSGWTGLAHNADIILGASISFRTLRRCSITPQLTCLKTSDCPQGETCNPTCDCNSDKSCEIIGPTGGKNCVTTLEDCVPNRCIGGANANQACASDANCPASTCTSSSSCATGVACVSLFGPPLPLASGGSPVCIISYFDGPLTGTADAGNGSAVTRSNLKSRVFGGIGLSQPCPRCGVPSGTLKVGQQTTCEGGQFPGAACTVDGVSIDFGGTSKDCPPELGSNYSGAGLAIRFSEVTTGTTTKTAQLPCGNGSFKSNPLNAPANPGKCLDNSAACTTNSDCQRCSEDPTTACTSNGDCSGKGTCATAPDQPVTCGYWCNCGFCGGNASLPCFENSDCAEGVTCNIGPGTGSAQNVPQQKPNDCGGKFICGLQDKELCSTATTGECTLQPYRNCVIDATCIDNFAGTCNIQPRPCFEPRITRTGKPSPLGKYCAYENKTCNSNADCTGNDDFCASDSSRPETVALFCVPATSSPSINIAGGITGPGAVRLNGFIKICRCGDGIIGCDEQCDDSNFVNGDGCSDLCQLE